MASTLTLEILNRLIGFDTTSAKSNLELLAYVRQYLADCGVESHLVFNDEQSKANLYATIGPVDKPGIMLSGHTDTVPVAGQNWSKNPYQLSEDNGRYYGRGTTDMKAFLAVVLAAVPALCQRELHTPIHLAFSYDEEIGCIGVRRLIETMQGHPVKPAICIIGEPTLMQVVTSHKGKLAARVSVRGKECHSGMAPHGVNAVNYAARLVCWLENLAGEKARQGPFEEGGEIPYSTVHTGTISGGTALNIVPKLCSFDFEIRNVAADDPQQMLSEFSAYAAELSREMQQTYSDTGIDIAVLTEYPGLKTTDDLAAIEFVKSLTHGETGSINFGTEGGLFSRELNVATLVCGPGSMEQGHKPDEYIHVDQIERCERFMLNLIAKVSG
ncbi:acetylornithine deacetylase [Halioxenophilus sp. WMMB6]|uniref:acetylornithine deacetylase n=1 Tax=Halioxenophilus sp. WMMB6 TaxID=3073815 RepID=UPI00295EF583|nr:acetylornithine deacetylase [Halioxenophilus sp. WMMB6]